MQRNQFLEELASEGFDEILTVEREANGGLALHVHLFEAKALVTRGELCLCIDNQTQLYRAGDVFHLQAGCPHSEYYGPDGVTYLVGRKRNPAGAA